jgi:hypothetical protein
MSSHYFYLIVGFVVVPLLALAIKACKAERLLYNRWEEEGKAHRRQLLLDPPLITRDARKRAKLAAISYGQ